MDIEEFCERHNIKTLPVNLRILNEMDDEGYPKKKYLDGEDGKFNDNQRNFKVDDFKRYSLERCRHLTKKYAAETKYIGIDTTDIQQLDIDDPAWEHSDEAQELFPDRGPPYFGSMTKNCPHYFIKSEKRNGKCTWHTTKVSYNHDVLTGTWGFVRRGTKVYDCKNNIPNVDWPENPKYRKTKKILCMTNDAHHMRAVVTEELRNRSGLGRELVEAEEDISAGQRPQFGVIKSDLSFQKEVVELIDVDPYLDEYQHWMRIVAALKTEGFDKEFATKISKKSGKYDDKGFDKMWDAKLTQITMGTLNYYAKLSNPTAYSRLFAKKDMTAEFNGTDFGLAEKFYEMEGDDMVYQNDTLYLYHNNKWIVDAKFEKVKMRFQKTMSLYVNNILREHIAAENKAGINEATVALRKVQTYKKVADCVQSLKSLLAVADMKYDVKFDVGIEQFYNLHFQNGVYEIKTKTFRPRNKTDYVTLTLPWDYIPKENVKPEILGEVRSFFTKLQPDEEQRRFTVSYMAYCLTGSTGHQVMKMNIGYEASNGKSTEISIHQKVFPIYTTKLDKRTFNQDFEKRHKELKQMITSPIRLAYIEELDRKRLDVDIIKDVVDGKDLTVEVLYGTRMQDKIQCKLMTCSNKDMNMEADEGVKRRVRVQYYKSKFIDHHQKDDFETNEYVKIKDYENRFEDPEYKNAYLHYLLESVDELYIPSSAQDNFEELAQEYDEFQNILDYRYEITKDANDCVAKGHIEAHFMEHHKKWPWVLGELKRCGLKYDRRKQIDKMQGIVYGLKEKPDDTDIDAN